MNRRNFTRLFLVLLATLFGAGVHAKQVPVNSFFTHNTYSAPRLSPSGRYLAVIGPDPGNARHNRLDIIDLKNMKGLRSYWLANREMFLAPYWIDDQYLVFETAFHAGGFDQPFTTGSIYSININSSDMQWLQGNKSWGWGYTGYEILRAHLPHDSAHIVTTSYSRFGAPEAFLVNARGNNLDVGVHTGQRNNPNARPLVRSPLADGRLMSDNSGRIRLALGWDPDGGESLWSYRGTDTSEWKPLPKYLVDSAGDVGPVGFTKDNKDILMFEYGESGAETLGLYRYDPETGKSTLWFAPQQTDIAGLVRGPHGKVVAAITMHGRPGLVLLSQEGATAKILKAFAGAFPDEFPDIVSWTRDGSEAIVEVSSDRDPGQFYLVNTKTLHAQFLFKHMPDIDPQDMAATQPIAYKARDGLTINGYLTLPNVGTQKNLPMIVLVHGGPHGVQDTWGFDNWENTWVQLLANRGYAVLQINYRGSGGYGKKFLEAGFHHWGTTMQYDVIDGTRWAIKQGYADPKRVCIFGASYGGFAAMRSSELAPDLFKCTVAYDGVYDLPMMFKKGDITWRSYGPYYLRRVLGTDMADLEDQSPVSHVDKLKSAIYLIQGGSDYRAPPAQVNALKAALDKAGKHYKYLYKANEGHGFYDLNDERQLAKKLLDFFARNIGSTSG